MERSGILARGSRSVPKMVGTTCSRGCNEQNHVGICTERDSSAGRCIGTSARSHDISILLMCLLFTTCTMHGFIAGVSSAEDIRWKYTRSTSLSGHPDQVQCLTKSEIGPGTRSVAAGERSEVFDIVISRATHYAHRVIGLTFAYVPAARSKHQLFGKYSETEIRKPSVWK